MEEMGLTDKDLGQYMGGRGRATKILNRQLSFRLAMIRELHKILGIPADVHISEPSIPEDGSGPIWVRLAL
jgi:HTH-type transcriptional regulator / antitoxin HigA